MESSHFGPKIPFITQAPDNFASPYRVVVVFDPVQAVTASNVCRGGRGYGPGVDPVPIPGVVRLHAVLCANKLPLTSVSAQVNGADGPSDLRFRQLVGKMTIILFPPRRAPAVLETASSSRWQ